MESVRQLERNIEKEDPSGCTFQKTGKEEDDFHVFLFIARVKGQIHYVSEGLRKWTGTTEWKLMSAKTKLIIFLHCIVKKDLMCAFNAT